MDIAIKTFTAEDVDFAVAQTAREGWATGKALFDLHLDYEPGGAFLAWSGNERVGMVTAVTYAVTGWLGNLIVTPRHRKKGIGRALMEHAFSYLRDAGARTIRLDADPPGIALYRSMGFVEEFESRRFRCAGVTAPAPCSAERLSPDDLQAATTMDGECFGDERGRFLAVMLRYARDAIVLKEGGNLAGFLFMTQTSAGVRIGPCCATTLMVAEKLISAALEKCGGGPINLGIPGCNQQGCNLLTSLGFEATPSSWRMLWGERQAGGTLDNYFATAGGAVG